jgi:hypothetical protein
MSQKFIGDLFQFQSLLNSLYERSVRECFESSVTVLTSTLTNIMTYMSESVSKGSDMGCLMDENFIPEEENIMLRL